jgi:hypothetical protein
MGAEWGAIQARPAGARPWAVVDRLSGHGGRWREGGSRTVPVLGDRDEQNAEADHSEAAPDFPIHVPLGPVPAIKRGTGSAGRVLASVMDGFRSSRVEATERQMEDAENDQDDPPGHAAVCMGDGE